MSDRDRATGVALSLCRVYLSCKDAFPTPQMKDDWALALWHEACVKTGANLESFTPYDLVSPFPRRCFVYSLVSVCGRQHETDRRREDEDHACRGAFLWL